MNSMVQTQILLAAALVFAASFAAWFGGRLEKRIGSRAVNLSGLLAAVAMFVASGTSLFWLNAMI